MTRTPHHVDVHVGRRLRMRRLLLGLSQERLGEQLGLTFQQIQKYERGANRLGASRLYEAARALSVDVGFFFEGLEATPQAAVESALPPSGDEADERRRATLDLVRAFERIDDPELRRRVLELTSAVAEAGVGPGHGA
jgi:transcriptional regulator with XRE-family HTH domain